MDWTGDIATVVFWVSLVAAWFLGLASWILLLLAWNRVAGRIRRLWVTALGLHSAVAVFTPFGVNLGSERWAEIFGAPSLPGIVLGGSAYALSALLLGGAVAVLLMSWIASARTVDAGR